MQKTYGNEIGGAEMVTPKRRDPLIYAGVEIRVLEPKPEQAIFAGAGAHI